MAKKLALEFYMQPNVCTVAKKLLGKVLCTNINGSVTKARIVETEAYDGIHDRASHAWNNRRTNRTSVLYETGGISYVYFCYGLHHLFNVVINKKEIPQAVLIRAAEPIAGIETMLKRRNMKILHERITKGPACVCEAMCINLKLNGKSLVGKNLWLEDDGFKLTASEIVTTTRIGVDYAGKDALLPYRFYIKGNPFVSKPV